MNLESLDQGIVEKTPIKTPVHICFTALEYERWKMIRTQLKEIDERLKIQEFGRIALRKLMDELEVLIINHQMKNQNDDESRSSLPDASC